MKLVGGRMKVLVGTMNAYTPNAIRYSVEAEALGADGLMIIPPYYYTPTEDEIFNYYKAICEACDLPIMLYNNPFTSNVDMSAEAGRVKPRKDPSNRSATSRRLRSASSVSMTSSSRI